MNIFRTRCKIATWPMLQLIVFVVDNNDNHNHDSALLLRVRMSNSLPIFFLSVLVVRRMNGGQLLPVSFFL